MITETSIILAVLGFVLGSIQYQIRIRLQDTKEDILRMMRYYSGRGGVDSLSLSEAIRNMRSKLKESNLSREQSREYKESLEEYDRMSLYLKVTGIYVPFPFPEKIEVRPVYDKYLHRYPPEFLLIYRAYSTT